MIKKLLLAALLAMPMCLAAQTMKFGTVNSQEIFNLMPDKATAETTMKDAATKYQTELKKLQDEFTKKYTDYQTLEKDKATPQTIKDRRMQELQENQQKIQNFQQMAQEDLQKQQETLLAPITDKIQKAIQAVGAEGGFTFIYDLSIPAVVYTGSTAQDVTPLVKAKLGIK
jgi:outer membrane protein